MSGQFKTILGVLVVVGWVSPATMGANPSVCVVVQEGCYVPGSMVHVVLELGEGEPVIVGGQFSIQYNPAILDFVDISPGGTCSPGSPFVLELYEIVNEVSGEIFYGVTIDIGGAGTPGPATMACLSFLVLERTDSNICVADGPLWNFLVDDSGFSVPIDNTEDCPVEGMPPSVSCDEVETSYTCVCPTGVPDCSAWDDDCNSGECFQPPARCEAVPANEGGPCDDGDACTTIDVCINGVCVGSGCTNQSVCVVAEEGCLAFEGAQLRLELGEGEPMIVGGQFWIQYDPAVLDFVDIAPGSTCDPESPFSLEIFQDANELTGEIAYAVGVDFARDGYGTQGPATLACLSFAFSGDWESDVCLVTGQSAMHSMLVDRLGVPVSIYNAETCPAQAPPPILCCDGVRMDEDCTCMPGTADCCALSTECLEGFCNEETGRCETVTINEGGPCDDGDSCTEDDRCTLGVCKGSGCTNPSLCILEEDCVNPGLPNEIRVRLGKTDRVVTGGQFSIVYDSTALDLVDISPGATCDPQSPFNLEVFEKINEDIGEAFYAVSLLPGGQGTSGPATMACLTFIALKENPGEVCLFNGLNPFNTVLVNGTGTVVGIYNGEECPLYGYPPSFFSCTEVCTIPTVSEWGLVVMTLLLLVAAKIRFGWVDPRAA